jgi:hypothetical protein
MTQLEDIESRLGVTRLSLNKKSWYKICNFFGVRIRKVSFESVHIQYSQHVANEYECRIELSNNIECRDKYELKEKKGQK